MIRYRKGRGFAAMVLAAALFFHALPLGAGAQSGSFRRIQGPEALTTGAYLLVADGYAAGTWEKGWLTAVPVEPEADVLPAIPGALWSLQVDGENVTLTDENGVAVCPGPEGISPGDGTWTVSWEDGSFVFRSVYGDIPVVLAANLYAGHKFRAYPEADVTADPEVYPSGFALYRLEPETPEQTTAPTETEAPTETTVPVQTTAPAETGVPETTAPVETTVPEQTVPVTTSPEETVPEAPELPWKLYFGRLHSHSAFSDGTQSVEDLYAHAKEAGLDFYAVTDHSDSLDNNTLGAIGTDGTAISTEWAAGKAAARDGSGDGFLGIFGYEMSWQGSRRLGHVATFATPGWQSREQEAYAGPDALTAYYDALSTVPGSVSVFCHPGINTGNFEDFGHWSPVRDRAVSLLEIGGEEGFFLDSYLLALQKGWHVAPSVSRHSADEPGRARTVVLAKELTEEALYEALAARRVYATQDSDLQVYFTLNGSVMGTVSAGASTAELRAVLYDPTDSIGTVEVLDMDGTVRASETAAGRSGTVAFSLPGTEKGYFLRITQPDGDVAVTAPVWLEQATDMGIRDFTADTQLPLRGKPLKLTLSLYNNERVDFQAETAVFSVSGEVIHAVNLDTIPGGGEDSYTFSYTHPGLGIADILATVTGTVAGEKRTYERVLTLRFRMEDTLGRILVDGSHGGVGSYDRLAAIAAEAGVAVTVADKITWEQLEQAQLLLIPAGTSALEPDFLALASEFVKNGGSLLLCGRSDREDGAIHWSAEGNRLLKSLGLTLRLQDDTVLDPVHNGGQPESLAVTRYNTESDWCRGLTQENIYRQRAGCTVSGGTWLVRCFDTAVSQDCDGDGGGEDTVLLAAEESRWGGNVFVSGGNFLGDGVLPEQESYWDPVDGNQVILENLLEAERVELALSDIRAARDSREGSVLHIRGYVTAGTSNPHNRFPEMIYVQDSTGGIAVTGFRDTGIQVGTPLEIIGLRESQDGNPSVKLVEYRVADGPSYRYDPDNSRHKAAMDYAENGGRLLQVEGKVTKLTLTKDGKGVARLTLKDARGDPAEILIEDYIFSGATGKNDLAFEIKKGCTVRARGILHLDGDGKPVLRVRNCDEVVYVPPNIIPKTGDDVPFALITMFLSGGALLLLRKRRTAHVGATIGRPK